jgi:glycosyltransferase involved in cell wall biosynthesis
MAKIILQIDACKNTLSTGKISEDIGKVAISKGWDSWKAYSVRMENDKPSASHLIPVGSMADVYCHKLETSIFDNHCFGFASIGATRKLIKKIEEIKPNVIHLHDIKGYWLNHRVLFEYFANLDIPIVWTLHDSWMFTGHCAYPTFVPCYRFVEKTPDKKDSVLTHGCHNCPRTREYPASYVFDRSRKNYRLKREAYKSVKNLILVPVSNWLGDVARQSYLSNCRIEVIHNGVDIDAFKPQDSQYKDEIRMKYGIVKNRHIILGVAAPWSERKGLKDFIQLSKNLRDSELIVLVGLTKEQIDELPKNIIGITRTDNQKELACLYSMADVFVNPTYADNFPTVNLEALACGIPVVTYNTGGSPEAIDEGTGIVVEQGDITALRKAIDTVLGKGNMYFFEACRRRSEDFFDKDKCFLQYIRLYEEIVKSKQ